MVTESLNRPDPGLWAGTATVFALFRLKIVGVQGAFGVAALQPNPGNPAASGDRGIVALPSPDVAEAGFSATSRGFCRHPGFTRATNAPASKSFLSDFLYGFAD